MYLGKIVEIADRETIYSRAHHPYTQALLSAVPDVKQADDRGAAWRIMLEGDVPSPHQPAVRVPLPDPLLAGPGDLRQGRAAAAADRPAPQGRLPLRRRTGTARRPRSPGALAVDDQGGQVPGATPTPLDLGPRWADEWFDVKTKTMVSA